MKLKQHPLWITCMTNCDRTDFKNANRRCRRNNDHHGNPRGVTAVKHISIFTPIPPDIGHIGLCAVLPAATSAEGGNVLYLLGLSLRLVLRARKGLCSCPSSNGSKALERKPCRETFPEVTLKCTDPSQSRGKHWEQAWISNRSLGLSARMMWCKHIRQIILSFFPP